MGEGIQDAVLFLAVTSFDARMHIGLGCHAVSVSYLLGHYDAPWAEFWPGREMSTTTAAPAMVGNEALLKRSIPSARWPERSTPFTGRVSD